MSAVDEDLGSVRDRYLRQYSEVQRGYCYFENGDVLFAKVSPCMQNGKHAIVDDLIDGLGFGSTEFHVLRPGPRVVGRWLLHLLRRRSVLEQAEATFAGSVGLQRVPQSFLESLPVELPSIEVQQAAVRRLDDALAESRRASLSAAEAATSAAVLVRAVLQIAFGSNPPIAAGPASTRGTQHTPLLSLARLESGHTPSRRHPEWWGGPIPWLALPDIRKLHGKLAHETIETINDAGLANSSARLLPVGTVCLCRDASIGFVTMLGRAMATSQHFCNWVCDPERLDPEFLMYAFMASFDYLRELGSGSVLKTIYMPTIQSFHVSAPAIEEQRRIARTLREQLAAAEALQTRLTERQAEIERLPQRILAAAFGEAD
jgi:type I restriction enzyme S subunit